MDKNSNDIDNKNDDDIGPLILDISIGINVKGDSKRD